MVHPKEYLAIGCNGVIMKNNLSTDPNVNDAAERREYDAPDFVLEIELETRAGSVLPDSMDPLDLTGLGTGTDYLP